MTVTSPTDAELLGAARDGNADAVGELYRRHHAAGLRQARSYGAGADAEDLVNEAFERVIAALRRGRGPDDVLRPYLYVTIRRLAIDRAGGPGHRPLDEVPESVALADADAAIDPADTALVAEAFGELPDRWQTVLWHTAVEGRRPREVARAIGIPANTVAVLAHRARERLRERYLQAHLRTSCPPACAPHRARLGAHVRGSLTTRHGRAVEAHLAECADCRRLAAELDDVNRLLARSVLPVFALVEGTASIGAGAAGSAGAASGGAASGAAAGAGGAAAGLAGMAGVGTIVKVAATVAAVVGLAAVAPVELGSRDDPAIVVAGGSTGSTGTSGSSVPGSDPASPTTAAPAVPPVEASEGPAEVPDSDPGSDLDVAAGDGEVDVGLGLGDIAGVDATLGGDAGLGADVGVDLAPLPGVDVTTDARVSLTEGVELDATWRAGPLGTGTLALDVANGSAAALVGADLVVDLSPAARPTSLLGGLCQPTDRTLVGAVLSLLASLTCELVSIAPSDDTALSLPLAVLGRDQTAEVRLVAGGVEVAAVTVDLR